MTRSIFRTSLIYFLIAIAIALVAKPGAWVSFPGAVQMITTIFSDVFTKGWIVLLGAGAVAAFTLREAFVDTLRTALTVLVALVMFLAGFMLIKTSMPFIVPFWADPMLARLDRVLGFGADPWIVTHGWIGAPGHPR